MGKTIKFSSDSALRNWLRKKKYTKERSPLTGVYTKGGTRVGSAFEKQKKGKRVWEVDIY